MNFMEALAQQSIEGSINLIDMSVILVPVLDSFILGHGWIHWHSFDPNMRTDQHAWCVYEKGNVYNYPDNQLISGKYGTIQVIRRPWVAYLVAQTLLFIEKLNIGVFFIKILMFCKMNS